MNQSTEWKWKRQQEDVPHLYANLMNIMWTLDDVTAKLGQLVSDSEDPNVPFVAKEIGFITFSWRGAKMLRNNLVALIDSYEKTNGEISLDLKLPSVPE